MPDNVVSHSTYVALVQDMNEIKDELRDAYAYAASLENRVAAGFTRAGLIALAVGFAAGFFVAIALGL